MCTLRGIIWYIIHANRMLLKIWPHLTFGWPSVNISLAIHPTHSKPYIFVILITSRVIWYTWKVIWNILKIWPPLAPFVTLTGKGPNRPKFCQNIFWPITTSKPSITHFRQNGTWVLLSTTVFNYVITSPNQGDWTRYLPCDYGYWVFLEIQHPIKLMLFTPLKISDYHLPWHVPYNPRTTKPFFFCNTVYQGGWLPCTPLMNLEMTSPKYDCLVPWYRVGSFSFHWYQYHNNQSTYDVTMTFSNIAGLKKRNFSESRP